MEASVGLGKSWMPMSVVSAMARSATAALAARMSSNCEMSAPETKALPPAPENTTSRTRSSSLRQLQQRRHRLPHVDRQRVVLGGLLKRMCSAPPSSQACTRSVVDT
jgi:hypothetical protein